jgi:Methyltransferase domain
MILFWQVDTEKPVGNLRYRLFGGRRAMDGQSCYYERHHNFNRVTAWLHSFRYQAVLSIVKDFASKFDKRPLRILDIGCAHARLFPTLNDRYSIEYVGIELSQSFAAIANDRYGNYGNFRVICGSATNKEVLTPNDADIVVALECLEHIDEQDVVRLVERVAQMKPGLFVCSVPVEIGPAIWLKNVGSFLCGYMRHKEYTWAETFWAGLYQLDRLPPHEIGHKGFDWRWLAQTIRHNFQMQETRRLPISVLPAGLNTTVLFVARPRQAHPQDDR